MTIPRLCANCGTYPKTTGGICECHGPMIGWDGTIILTTPKNYPTTSRDDLGPIFTESGITHCRDGSIELRDAKFELVFTLPTDGGIIFSDEFLSALSEQLSEYESKEKETTS